jgi:S1-C subfamily serine protease
MWLTVQRGPDPAVRIKVEGERFIIGRDDRAELTLDDSRVSWRHSSLRSLPNGDVEIRDLESTNGTFVNGQPIEGPVVLTGGEQIQIGDTVLISTRDDTPVALIAGASADVQVPAWTRPPGPATIERRILRKTANRAIWLASGSVVVALALAAAFLTGTIGGAGDTRTAVDVIEKTTPSTVLVLAEVAGQPVSSGTGWVLDAAEGLIVTNGHVVNGGETFGIGFDNQLRRGSLIAVAPCEDLAILKVADRRGLRTLPIGSQAGLRRGETVVALGYPANASLQATLQATTGVVSVVDESFDVETLDVPKYKSVIQITAAINPGNSGGPLVDLDGKLVGISSAGITSIAGRPVQGQGYAIGIDHAQRILDTLRRGRSMGWTGMGFRYPVSETDSVALGLPSQPGLIVTEVVADTPAAAAGLSLPALLVAVDGNAIGNTLASYCTAVAELRTGQTALFSIVSGEGDRREVKLRFG